MDVVVVGAGAAGLEAARVLRARGRWVCILEARARMGGRILTYQDSRVPLPIELGAEFLHGEAPGTERLFLAGAVDSARRRRARRRGRGRLRTSTTPIRLIASSVRAPSGAPTALVRRVIPACFSSQLQSSSSSSQSPDHPRFRSPNSRRPVSASASGSAGGERIPDGASARSRIGEAWSDAPDAPTSQAAANNRQLASRPLRARLPRSRNVKPGADDEILDGAGHQHLARRRFRLRCARRCARRCRRRCLPSARTLPCAIRRALRGRAHGPHRKWPRCGPSRMRRAAWCSS